MQKKENGIVADDYYNSRALGSRIGAWASKQSSKLKNREELLERIALMEKNLNLIHLGHLFGEVLEYVLYQ